MKNLVLISAATAVGLLTATSAFAKGGGGNSAPPPLPAIHHSASTPALAPGIGGGAPHLSGTGSYRPLTLSAGGNHTLVYPSVRSSNVHPQGGANVTSVSAIKTGGGNVQSKPATGGGNPGSTAVVIPRGKNKLDPQTTARLRNPNGGTSSAAQAQAIHASNCHHHHGKDWWKHHCVALIFFDWGWWGWYDGWWYPAWGYDAYSNYEYNEPIYGANGEAPDQIVAGVQAKLQQLGYYTYAIDGKMGPLTQGAIARYQRDHHMSISNGIDQPTLISLGIVH